MNRRSFLRGIGLIPLGLLICPTKTRALGGVLPPLNLPAPDFDLPAVLPEGSAVPRSTGEARLNLGDWRGRWLILYFYPRDFTTGCTLEARGFQRDLQAFHAADAEVIGVSADTSDSHTSFCDQEGLVFPLLSDPGGEVSARYGSWIPPFSQRHTFLIDPEGVLRARWLAVRPAGHSQEVLAELSRLQGLPSPEVSSTGQG
jgi:peroxiredoxin Q/BCP